MDGTNHESTLRDTLAAAAVSGFLAGYGREGIPSSNRSLYLECIAKDAFDVADAMLAERAKAKKPTQHAFPRGNGR